MGPGLSSGRENWKAKNATCFLSNHLKISPRQLPDESDIKTIQFLKTEAIFRFTIEMESNLIEAITNAVQSELGASLLSELHVHCLKGPGYDHEGSESGRLMPKRGPLVQGILREIWGRLGRDVCHFTNKNKEHKPFHTQE